MNTLRLIRSLVASTQPPESEGASMQVTATLQLDALATAEAIEHYYADLLLPPEEGYYLPTSLHPVLRPGQFYYQKLDDREESQLAPLTTVDKLLPQRNVYDQKHKLVVPAPMVTMLSAEPILPWRGLGVVYAAVDHTLRRCAAWKRKSLGPIGAFIAEHLKEEFRPCLPEDDESELLMRIKGVRFDRLERNSAVRDRLLELLAEHIDQVQQFVGKDTWVMHFHYQRGLDIVVEKTVDFRIFDWERRMASGEWK